jgi:formylglycine-generating enzyme required for sulfatase activity
MRGAVARALMIALSLCLPTAVWAQTASFFSQLDDEGDTSAARDCLQIFSGELLAAGLVERPSTEVETLMRECVEDRSNPSFVRECDLSLARGQVNYVFLVGAEQDGADWVFRLTALSPASAGAVWQRVELAAGSSALRAARDRCSLLANDFLTQQGFVDSQPSTNNGAAVVEPDALPAVVHVVSVTPSPSTMVVDGREVGLAPGQFEVPAGVATPIELRSPGYSPWSRTVTVAAGGTERLQNISLAALPATLQVTANVQGAEVVVDGAVVGTTVLNRAVSVNVPSGSRQLTVRLDGFDEYRTSVTLAPGAAQSLTAALSATPAGPPPAPSGFVYVAAGTFTMGSPNGEEGRGDDEVQHQVTLSRGFWLQMTEVTQGEWQAVMGNNPSHFSNCGSTCPVERVTWLDAVGYANTRSRAEGLSECYDTNGNVLGGGNIYTCGGYRLPTEAEWEYAARAGSTSVRYGELDQVAWHAGNAGLQTHPVGQLQPNALGLFDMLGNVWEWTHDWYGAYDNTITDPMGAIGRSNRVFRGGGWLFGAQYVRSADRNFNTPADRRETLGFRLARSAP